MTTAYVIYKGPHNLDLTPAQGKLLDAEQGGAQGYRTDRDGYEDVEAEILQAYPTAGTAAGIPQDVFEHFVATNETVDFIDDKLVVARKQVEVLEESRAFYVDARQNDVALMCDSMRSKAQRRKDPSILTPFEKTLAYQSATGVKAAKTRKLNAIKAKFDEAVTLAVRSKIA